MWTLTRLLLFTHKCDVSTLIVNYLLRNFEEIFGGRLRDDIPRYIHLFFCYQYIFHKQNDFSEKTEIIVMTKNSIQDLLEKLLVSIDSKKFLETHFYLNIHYEYHVFDENMKAIYEGNKLEESHLKSLTETIKNEKSFQEKMILVLAFLKQILSE